MVMQLPYHVNASALPLPAGAVQSKKSDGNWLPVGGIELPDRGVVGALLTRTEKYPDFEVSAR